MGTGLLTINAGTTIDAENTTARTVSNAQQWNGSFAYGATGDLTFNTGAITLNADPTITFNNAKTLTISSVIGETGGDSWHHQGRHRHAHPERRQYLHRRQHA